MTVVMTDAVARSLVERLLGALAAQLAASDACELVPAAQDHLDRLTRAEARSIYGAAGHLVHFDNSEVHGLVDAISAIQRRSSGAATLRPGDVVHVAGAIPQTMADLDSEWVRRVKFTVRFFGEDGTVDVQPDLSEDYIVRTVPATSLRPETGLTQ